MNKENNGANRKLVFARATRVWLAINHNTRVTSGELHGQMSLAAVNQIRLNHEAINGCKI